MTYLLNRAVWACMAIVLTGAAALGQTADDVPKLIDTIKDQDKSKFTRAQAIDDLGTIGADAKAAVPVLMQCLKDPNVVGNAVVALGKIGPNAKEAMPALVALLRLKPMTGTQGIMPGTPGLALRSPLRTQADSGWTAIALRPAIIESMVKIGLEPKQCVPALAEVIAQDDPVLRFNRGFQQGCLAAVKALEPLGPKAKDAVPALIQLLNNTAAWTWNPQGPREAIVALGKIGRDAEPALPSLRKRLGHDDPEVAKSAEDAIARIQKGIAAKPADPETPKEADIPKEPEKTRIADKPREPEKSPPIDAGIAKLLDALGDSKAETRDGAIEALAKMGDEAVPALQKTIASADAEVRKNALACLCKMGKAGRAAAPACIAALKDPSAEVRRNAAYALGRMGTHSREAITALTAALKDKDREVRLLAAFALEKVRDAK